MDLSIGIANDTFSVGDYIMINYDLFEATSLNKLIYIKSNDMGLDYSMSINEDGCLLCDNNINGLDCNNCSEGIKIEDNLSSYDINDNSYEIYISSDIENIILDQTNPLILIRNVMQIEVIIEVEANSSQELYPGKELYITPIIDKLTSPTQPNGTIYIEFDDYLSFIDGTAQMFIDFYNDYSCIIMYNDITIDCNESIIISSEMQYKAIENNNYTINLWSKDIELTGDTSYIFQRQIQTLSVEFSKSLFLGEVIQLFVNILDSEVFQADSTITVTSPNYAISSSIIITYNNNNNLYNDTDTQQISNSSIIKRCDVLTEITQSQELCSAGIQFSTSDITLLGSMITLYVHSDDTYLVSEKQQILIEDCPIGQGLTGSDVTSYVCDDCPSNAVGLTKTSECISCDGISGIDCYGKDELIISYNYWMAINHPNHTYLFDLFKADSIGLESFHSQILATFCPSGFCCQNEMGCNFNNKTEELRAFSTLCGVNRDPFTPLCGSCIDGYSEAFGSSACKNVKQITINIL